MDSGGSNYQNIDTGYPNYPHVKSLELPPNLLRYPNQVDGHGAQGKKPSLLFSTTGNIVYKPVQKFPKGLHEVSLYTLVFDDSCTDNIIFELRKFMPTYIGVFHDVGTHKLFFGMKDLLASFQRPSVCDIKLGRKTYTPDSEPEKVAVERQKYRCQYQLGFAITAMKLSSCSDGNPIHLNRTYFRLLTPDKVYSDGIYLFLSCAGGQEELVRQRASTFLSKLNELIDWFERQNRFTFYASSLLLAYDNVCFHGNGPLANGTLRDEVGLLPSPSGFRTSVKLIDFTRWRHQPVPSQRDDNVLYGLRRLANFFQQAESGCHD